MKPDWKIIIPAILIGAIFVFYLYLQFNGGLPRAEVNPGERAVKPRPANTDSSVAGGGVSPVVDEGLVEAANILTAEEEALITGEDEEAVIAEAESEAVNNYLNVYEDNEIQ